MNENARFSVVIPAYGRPDLLDRALESVLAQTYEDFEIIVIDDASPAPLEETVCRHEDSRVNYFRCDVNGGGSAARNIGVERSRGTHIAFLDSDDYWLPNKLQRTAESILQNEGCGVFFHEVAIKKSSRMVVSSLKNVRDFNSYLEFIVLGDGHLQTSALTLERSLARKHPFDARLARHQDLNLYVSLRPHFETSAFICEPLSVWDISHEAASISRSACVEDSVRWIRSVGPLVGHRVLYQFVLRFIYARNVGPLMSEEVDIIREGLRKKYISASELVTHSVHRLARLLVKLLVMRDR